MKLRRLISLLVIFMLLLSPLTTYGGFNDVEQDSSFAEALERVAALGIISGTGNGSFEPYGNVTREQFATMIVKAAGLEDTAKTMSGTTVFPDVDLNDWAVGYINTAVSKGYITGMADGKFHPEESITYAQACTILVRALGYTDNDLSGLWPKNYIDKARIIGLAPGMDFSSGDALPRWAAAVMIDKLLITNIKAASVTSAAKTFSESTGQYTECIVLADSSVSSKLMANQILTDKGTFYLTDSDIKLELGSKYKMVIKDNKIQNAYKLLKQILNISVDSAVETKITYKIDGKLDSMTLPQNTNYYYQGKLVDYANLKSYLQGKTSIIMAYNDEKTGFDYGVVIDPVYSKPQVVVGNGLDSRLSGGMSLDGYTIVKDGVTIGIGDLENKDVVYLVSDVWNQNKTILVITDQVEGEITAILPNKFAPTSIKIDDVNYSIGNDLDMSKVNTTPGSFSVGDNVTLLFGSDGKVVDIMDIDTEDNSYFAFVINSGYTVSDVETDYGKIQYNVKLLLTDGSVATYKVSKSASDYKGKLVKYQVQDDDRAYIEEIEYNYLKDKEHTISTDQRLMDNIYVAENVKIFNILSNESGADAKAELLDWDEIPRGLVQPNKVVYVNRVGAFQDINVMVTNDLLDENYKLALVKSKSGSGNNTTYKLLIGGVEYSYNGLNAPAVNTGTVYKVKLVNGKVNLLVEYIEPKEQGSTIDAIDSKRIQVNDKVFWFRNSCTIYKMDEAGTIITVSPDEVDLGLKYTEVSIYLDKDSYYGGKVDVVYLIE